MYLKITSLLALAAAAPALGQSNPTVPTTDAEGNDVVVTATRSGDGVEVRNLPASVTLLSADDLAERQTRLVSDVLRDVPGLAVSRTGAAGGGTAIRVRGAEANHVLVLVDGIKASDPYDGEFDFASLLADEAAKVEVLRGQQSSLYGSDAIGGVIQYITLTGREAPGATLRAEGGTQGTAAGGARVAGYSDALDYALSSSAFHTDGYPTARGGSRDLGSTLVNATGKISWTPSAPFKLTGVARYNHTDAQTNDAQNDPASPLFGYVVDSPGTHYRQEGYYGLVRADLALAGGRWNNALTGQVADTTRRNYTAAGFNSGDKGRRWKGAYESSLRFGAERVVNRVTGALDYEREEFRNTSPATAGAFGGRRSTTNWGLVGQYELTVDDALSAGASVRRDWNDRFDDATTWRAQAGYRFANGVRLRGAYGTGVKNPGYYELYGYYDGRYIGNPDLRPEKSRGWEAGADYDLGGGRASVGATYFRSRLHDEIYTTYPAPDYVATPGNRATSSKQRGVEVFASARAGEQVRFDLAYTYLHATEDGANEVRRPHHIASANATVFSRDRRLSSTLTLRYNGAQDDVAYIDPSYVPSRVRLRDYLLVNLNADYRLTDRLSLFGRVENLFDDDHEEVFSFAAPGRSAVGGVRARF